jgi:hypothetical protein
MVWLNRTEIQKYSGSFLKLRPAVCALAQDFSQEQDFPEKNLLLPASRI